MTMDEKSRTPWLDSLERAERIRDARERFKAEHPDEAEAMQRAREAEAEARFGPFQPPKRGRWRIAGHLADGAEVGLAPVGTPPADVMQHAAVARVGRGHLLPPIKPAGPARPLEQYPRPPMAPWYIEMLRALAAVVRR
jgi:hypothetical protein